MALTDAQKEAQLRAVGWTPSAGDSVASAWARTATPADQAAAAGPAQNAFDPKVFAQQVTQAMSPLSQATSGVTAADLAERKRQFDASLEWQKQMWANQGLPQLQIQQQAAALAQAEFEQQKQIAAQNFQLAQQTQAQSNALGVASATGYYTAPTIAGMGSGTSYADAQNQIQSMRDNVAGLKAAADAANVALGQDPNNLTLRQDATAKVNAYTAAQNDWAARSPGLMGVAAPGAAGVGDQGPIETLASRMAKANLGLDYLKTAASMGGPADIFQADDFARGAVANGAPAFLTALRNNTGLAPFGATSGAAPTPMTAGGLIDRLGGVASPDHSAALNAIGGIAQAGGGALAPQAMESLNPDEIAAMGSGFKKLGYSMPAFLQQYAQSRVGQGAARAA